MTYHEIDNGIGTSLHNVILWQYENAERLKAFIESMCEAAYSCVDDFWDKWAVFRANLAKVVEMDDASFGLSMIGSTCGIPRPDGISDAMYAKLIRCRMTLMMTTHMSTADYKTYMNDLFGDGETVHATLTDNMNMSVSTSYDTDETTGDYYVLYHSENNNDYGRYWLILPTGVKRGLSSWGGIVFGFDRFDGDENHPTIPNIGAFDTKFITLYQKQYATGS